MGHSYPGRDERLQGHTARLHSVVEMGVVGESPAEQARRILEDCRDALSVDYAEAGECAGTEREYWRLWAAGDVTALRDGHLGHAGSRLEKARLIFDTSHDGAAEHYALSGLRSVLFWPFSASGKDYLLTFAWKEPRTQFVTEQEMQYLDFVTVVFSRLLETIEEQRRVAERAATDALTGIPNRSAVIDYLEAAISAAQRDGTRVALLYIDLNHFKRINDDYGHSAGDEALRTLSAQLKTVVRKHEMCGRLGGDEFCLVVPSLHDREELTMVAKRVLSTLSRPLTLSNGVELQTGGSVGIAIYPENAESAPELLRRADEAMYRAKRAGKAAFAFYDGLSATIVEAPLRIDRANFRGQFVLCYQPIVAARSGRPIAAEVLPRWLHPDGMRLPERFLAAAREQNALGTLDRTILETAVNAAAHKMDGSNVTLHVNISQPDETILQNIARTPVSIALEVSEFQVAAQEDEYVRFFSACRTRGYRVGLAHFGSGNLSLRTLTMLNPDFVKISAADLRKETGGMRTDYIKLLIDQAHHLSSLVIAESIETQPEYEWMIASGADALQGFEISSPLAEEDFYTWLRRYAAAAPR